MAEGVGVLWGQRRQGVLSALEKAGLSFVPTKLSQSGVETGSLRWEGRNKLDVTLCVYVMLFVPVTERPGRH